MPAVLTTAPGHATVLAEEAVRNGTRVVVAAGGDGTVCEVVEGLHHAGRGSLGILPLGTGNDAARTLGLPLDLASAARTVLDSRAREVDLVTVNDRVVLNAVGIGLLGDINLRATHFKMLRGIAAYVSAALASLFRYRPPNVELTADGFEYRGRMTILAVHNGPTTGGGFRLTPAAVPDDGLLDACLVQGMPCLARLPRLVAALRGTLGRMRGSFELQAPSIRLVCDQPLPAHLDGNPVMLSPPAVDMRIVRGGLQVAGPVPAPAVTKR